MKSLWGKAALPNPLQSAHVIVDSEWEWEAVIKLLFARRIVVDFQGSELFRVHDQMLHKGTFAVLKPNKC